MKSVLLIANAKKAATSGKLDEAERILRQVVIAEPANVLAWQMLGRVLMDMRRPRHAAEVFGQAARLRPDQGEVLIDMARALGEIGQLAQALSAAKRATEILPNSAAAWVELARRYRMLSQINSALAAIRKAEQLAPSDPDVLILLSLTLHDLGRNIDSVSAGRRALASRRGLSEMITLANALLALGESDEAMSLYDESERASPGLPEAIAGKARAAEAMGDKKLALMTLEPIVDLNSTSNSAIGHYGMLAAGSPEMRPRAIDLVRRRLSASTNNPASTLVLWFSLGSLLEAEGDYVGAFDAFRRGKSLYPATFNADFTRRRMRELTDTFSAEAMTRLPTSNNQDARPVFIVGMPRSGTTLLEQIIASHPRAQGVGELEDILRLVNGATARFELQEAYPRCFAEITTDMMNQLAGDYAERLTLLAPGKDRIVDKMPHNYMALGAISLLFPRATLIHSRRHPLDTCLSCFTTALGPAHAYSTSLANLVDNYREYRRVMDHWRQVLGDRLVEMDYEKLVAEPEAQSRRLVAAAGLDWDPACLRFYEGKRAVTTASVSQVRRPMYDSSIGRWKRFESSIGELIEGLSEFL